MFKIVKEGRLAALRSKVVAWWSNLQSARPARLDLQVLEDRVLYSATPLPIDAAEASAESIDASLKQLDEALWTALGQPNPSPTSAHGAIEFDVQVNLPSSVEAEALGRSIMFVDESLSDLDQWLAQIATADSTQLGLLDNPVADLPQISNMLANESLPDLTVASEAMAEGGIGGRSPSTQGATDVVLIDLHLDDSADLIAAANIGALVFTYDSASDSAAEILARLEQWASTENQSIGSLSILSHGVSGAFEFGYQWITVNSLMDFADGWQQLAPYFTEDANIFILGCNVGAAGGDGQLLIDRLGELTGTDVFASSNITGVGGDWTLELFSSQSADREASVLGQVFDIEQLQSADVSLAWYDSSWQYRQTVTINESMVTGSSNLSNFAVLVSVTDANLKSVGNGGKVGQTDGGDLLFTSSDGTTKLDHQIESYDATTGTLLVWVEVPSLSYNVNTSLYLYYGNAGAADQWNNTGTWESNYRGVWHLGSNYEDSTSNNNDGTNSGTSNYTSAMIGAGDDFDGTSNYISTASTNAATANTFTASLWFNADATDFAHHLLWQGQSTGNGWGAAQQEMHISLGNVNNATQEANYLSFFLGDDSATGNDPLQIKTAFTDMAGWHYVTVVVSNMSTTPTATMYLDGVNVGSDTGTTTDTSRTSWDTGMIFGKPSAAQRYFDGGLDEVRLATTNRSADWVLTEYNNQNTPGTFVTMSTEEVQLANVVPGSQSTNEDTNIVFSSGNGNQISISDQDPVGSNQEVTLTVTNGTLTLSGTTGLTFVTGDGITDSTMTFRGTVSDINTALNGLIYTPTSNYSGSASLTMSTTDSTLVTLDIDTSLKGYYSFNNTGNLGKLRQSWWCLRWHGKWCNIGERPHTRQRAQF